MTQTINIYCLDEINNEYNNNLINYYNTINQYIEATNININLIDRILCKIITNEKFEKINILINELNRLINQWYLQFHIETNNSNIEISITNPINIPSGLFTCTFFNVSDNTDLIKLEICLPNSDTKYTHTFEKTLSNITVNWLHIKLYEIPQPNEEFTITITENTFITITHGNILQDLDLYILDFKLLDILIDQNYNQQISMQCISTLKNKLECYLNYLNEKINLIKKYKKLTI